MSDKNIYNGKINIMNPNISTKFSMMDKIPVNINPSYLNSLTGNLERSRLSDAYFSQENINIIQNGIRKGVYDKSNGTLLVDKQEPEKIVTVMRSMYLQYSKNLETNIPKQIEELNNYVLNFCIPNVYNETVSYLKYKEDSSKMYTPMQNPIYSSKTSKSLQQKPWF
tara:strand:+ start:1502 stop:2002 length:501 start_codon:yes stop_codon:yes gene_type:complete